MSDDKKRKNQSNSNEIKIRRPAEKIRDGHVPRPPERPPETKPEPNKRKHN